MGARILVVDDDPWILRMVSASLQKRSFVVETARDGRQALERVKAHTPDVIISDVMMPVMDGWAFVKQLRQDPRLAAIPVIFLTALGKDEAKLRALGLTEQDYLAKPFRFEVLERRVDAALSGRGGAGSNPASGVHPIPGYPHHQAPPGTNPASGVHPLPGYPHHQAPPGSSPNSGVYPLPNNPYGYPYPGQYPPPQYGQYPGQYPPPPYGQYPGQYPPMPGQYPPPAAPPHAGTPPAGVAPGVGPSAPPPPNRARRATALHGKLEQLGLSSLLVMMEMERKEGVLSLMKLETDEVGKVQLRGGQVVAAELEAAPDLGGRECVYRMLGWTEGTFSFSATTVDVEDTVQSSTTHLLMEGARLIDEAGRDEGL